MKKHSFFAGMLTMALIVGLGMSALAATGQVSFNASALTLNGTQVSAKGENYTLANGQSVPASITYTDEKGGGTTYLPVRRISELLGVETGWDGAAGAVTVKGEVKAPETTTPPTADYSTWSKEDEAAYQEFKGLWHEESLVFDVGARDTSRVFVSMLYTGNDEKNILSKRLTDASMITWYTRFLLEYTDASHPSALIVFYYESAKPGNEVAMTELYNGKAVIVK